MHCTRLGDRNCTRATREPKRNVYAYGGEHLYERLILTKVSTFRIHKNNRLGDKKVNESNEIKIAKMEKDIDRVETNSKSWWKEMKEDVAEIKTQLQNLPDVIICRLQENTDLKIQTKVQELENKINEKESATYRWIIGIGVGLIITMLGTIVSIVIQVAL